MCQGCVEAAAGWDELMDYLIITELARLTTPIPHEDMDILIGDR